MKVLLEGISGLHRFNSVRFIPFRPTEYQRCFGIAVHSLIYKNMIDFLISVLSQSIISSLIHGDDFHNTEIVMTFT